MKNLFIPALSILLLLFAVNGLAQVPAYNSYPSATATVLLDFDGQYVDGTSWNWSGPISLNPSNLTNTQVTEIFNRVSEDYRPFNVNITTDSTKYFAAPVNQRMRIVLTVSSDWYGAAGGVSFINSFTWGDNTPAFVFTALLNYNTKYIAEATAHEIGHTLGLRHQSSYDNNCVKTSEYNAGAGSGEIGWAPIMGVGYYRNMTLWNNGANPYGCTNYQDDLGVIIGQNGFGYRTDDHADSPSGTIATPFSNNQFSVNGVIEKITDQDFFQFNIPVFSQFHLDALPYNIGAGNNGSDLDMEVSLLSQSQGVLGTYNPSNTLGLMMDTMLAPGTYYLRVEGKGNLYAPEYASLGSYNLNATFIPSATLPVHQLSLQGKNDAGKHQLNWIIEADETVAEQVIESSSDAINFQKLNMVNKLARSYVSIPSEKGLIYYRLKVGFDNGHSYYSNIVALRSNGEGRPSLISNVIHNDVQVNAPSEFNYLILDYSGRMVAKGILKEGINHIDANNLSSGMYLIRYSNGDLQYADKLMKE